LKAFAPLAPPDTCPIGWQPNALEPVFYGVRDYSTADGAPADLRVFFPSLEGAVHSAPILDGCGRYPLVLFVHGDCSQNNANVNEHYLQWFYPQAQLAESGYVVVVPSFGSLIHPSNLDQPAYDILDQTRSWMRDKWEHRDVLMSEPATGIYGHSYGALISAIYATSHDVGAFAGLSGVWGDWPSSPFAFEGLTVPMLFIWGGVDQDVEIGDAQWNALPRPKHKIEFAQGQHWDYLPAGTTPCDESRGPCQFLKAAASDFVITFFSKYLAPELVPNLPDLIPDSLIPPPLDLSTYEQNFYGAGHLMGFQALSGNDDCEYDNDWRTPDTRTVPFVMNTPQSVADHDVRHADLVPQYSGPNGPQGSGPVYVSSQSPQPGARATVGDTVKMHLRRGPLP
jgi:pimeloyl-ACP methyl ester carboxylesterase